MNVWFEGGAISRACPKERSLWIVTSQYALKWTHTVQFEDAKSLQVPRNFITDLASIPCLLWYIVPPWDNVIRDAAVCHDRAYETNEISRELADVLLYWGMLYRGAPRISAYIVWCCVRVFGGPVYRRGHERQRQRLQKLTELTGSLYRTQEVA